ncbi:serine/Arginine-related protein 53 isoform X1 [Hyposmocoma kahamanoa]|uniref:serine/Arginine-related protein 53 isoform X1 n=1 Tax=Hyposmocoma kahamanoa TaxID=1477025 RepID=UPI000E6D623C|nr:serine/Arginine-related protein 53 isoform X1 [Hyposmocoma kahamanoa]
MPREKSRYRDRRSSSYSSDSSYEKKKKSKHKRRSRSRDRSESSNHKRKRSTSRTRRKRRSYSRSTSRDRYEKSRRRSSRSHSKKDRSLSRSSSRSRSKYSKASKRSHRRSRSSDSRSSSFEIGNKQLYSEDLSDVLTSLMKLNIRSKKGPLLSAYLAKKPLPPKRINLDDTEIILEKAIKAAEAAGLTMTKIPTYTYKEVEIKEDMPTIHDRNLLAELNSDSFAPKSFTSSRNKKESKNIVIDLNTQTVKMPETEIKQKDDSIIDFNEMPSEEELKEMWIKKLYQYRKRMLKGDI